MDYGLECFMNTQWNIFACLIKLIGHVQGRGGGSDKGMV